MRYLIHFPLAITLLLFSCKTDEERKFPDVSDLSDFPNTTFVTTMEDALPVGKTVVYAPAFLFAWDEIRNFIKAPIKSSSQNSKEFIWLNSSTSYQETLLKDEYITDVQVEDDVIMASAFFHKALPFTSRFQRLSEPLLFMDTSKVESFGMNYYDYDLVSQMQILYYQNDDNFVLKLLPKDSLHEIILMKGAEKSNNFAQYQQALHNSIILGATEKNKSDTYWKYDIASDDVVRIPLMTFNLETNYAKLEGQTFSADSKSHTITMAYQRTAFLLDESGAVVESETMAALDSAGPTELELTKPKPKKLILNKPFVLFIKRTTSENPYFAMKVENAELMVKPIPKKQ